MIADEPERKPTREECVREAGELLARMVAEMTPAERARITAAAEARAQREAAAAAPTPWLTIPEAAERARLSEKTIRRRVEAEQLKSSLIGRRRVIHVDWLDAFLISHARSGKAPR